MPSLYINGYQTEALYEDRRIVLKRYDGNHQLETQQQVPLFNLDKVVVIGTPRMTMPLLQQLLKWNIPVVFLSARGQWLSTLYANSNGNAFRRLRQYEAAKQPHVAISIANALVEAKIFNMRRHLQRLSASREQSHDDDHQSACQAMLDCLNKLEDADSVETIRGIEGIATACYFARLRAFFPDDMPFQGRTRRPPRDAVNALMSWTYAIVAADLETEIRLANLDPCLGFLHEISYGRASLALDLIEPLRPSLCDSLVMHLVNHRMLLPEHFVVNPEDGGINLGDEAKKIFFTEYEKTLRRPFKEHKDGDHVTYRLVFKNSVHQLCRFMEKCGELRFFHMP